MVTLHALHVPLGLPELIEQGFSLARIEPHRQGEVRREVPLLILADDVQHGLACRQQFGRRARCANR